MRKVIAGMPGWCVVFQMADGLYAMVNLDAGETIRFAPEPMIFTKHGYFVDPDAVPASDVQTAEMNLVALDLAHAESLLDDGRIAVSCARRDCVTLIEKIKEAGQ